ncbi:hypothetical protein CLV51_107122 [Chitinophaga niastensis]|uniref:Uncharacterized protein n=1 Tax=Chitinophaga niastensis TaxID=536980 RepID=A0A2P8HCG1_CHINA|nr:hypothetical protein [Chitinophaga niastensis]PSL43811.1 hypothetical protein CLV51_107122 [Chitinophaga niastensis]
MNSSDEIYRLMTEKLAGEISAVDEQLLDEIMEEDPIVGEKWKGIYQLKASTEPAPWLDVIKIIRRSK